MRRHAGHPGQGLNALQMFQGERWSNESARNGRSTPRQHATTTDDTFNTALDTQRSSLRESSRLYTGLGAPSPSASSMQMTAPRLSGVPSNLRINQGQLSSDALNLLLSIQGASGGVGGLGQGGGDPIAAQAAQILHINQLPYEERHKEMNRWLENISGLGRDAYKKCVELALSLLASNKSTHEGPRSDSDATLREAGPGDQGRGKRTAAQQDGPRKRGFRQDDDSAAAGAAGDHRSGQNLGISEFRSVDSSAPITSMGLSLHDVYPKVLGTRAAAEASRSDKDDQEDEHNHNHDSDHNHARGDQAGEGEHQEAHSWVARGSSAGGASVQRDDTAAAEELAQAAHITTPNLTQDGARLFDNDPFQMSGSGVNPEYDLDGPGLSLGVALNYLLSSDSLKM